MTICQTISILAVFRSISIIKIAKFRYFNYGNLNIVIIFAVGIEKNDTP